MFDVARDMIDIVGKGSLPFGLLLKVGSFLGILTVNGLTNLLTIVSLSVGIIYFLICIRHKVLQIKKLKRDDKDYWTRNAGENICCFGVGRGGLCLYSS